MRTEPVVFYISGPYRAPFEDDVFTNILSARREAEFVIRSGGSALCPHLNTMLMGGVVPDENFLQMDLILLARCDVVYAIQNFQYSKGAKAEIEFAQKLGIPVVFTRLEVLDIINTWSSSSSRASRSLTALLQKMLTLLEEREFIPPTRELLGRRCPDCGEKVEAEDGLDLLRDQGAHSPSCLYAQSVAQARLTLGSQE